MQEGQEPRLVLPRFATPAIPQSHWIRTTEHSTAGHAGEPAPSYTPELTWTLVHEKQSKMPLEVRTHGTNKNLTKRTINMIHRAHIPTLLLTPFGVGW